MAPVDRIVHSRLALPMPATFARTLVTVGFLGALCACAGDEGDSAAADSIARDAASRQPAPARPPITPGTPESAAATSGVSDGARPAASASAGGLGRWDVAALEKRLDLQGMAPRKRDEPVRHPFLSVAGTSYLVGNAELQVFIYEDAAAVDRDLAALDTVTVAPRGQRVKWPDKPTLIRNNNLAAILLGQNALQIERVQRALMAGLPPNP